MQNKIQSNGLKSQGELLELAPLSYNRPISPIQLTQFVRRYGNNNSISFVHLEAIVTLLMKRVADAMDGGDSRRYDRADDRSRKAPGYKRIRCADERQSNATETTCVTVKTLADDKETDVHRLAQRQKQIDYGKNTIGYDRYCAQVPRRHRRRGKHPMTPDKTMRMGKKVFDGIVRKWRQALHKYDPPELVEVIKDMVRDDSMAATIDGTTETVAASVSLEKGATTESHDIQSTVSNRSIYENFDDDDDSDDNLL